MNNLRKICYIKGNYDVETKKIVIPGVRHTEIIFKEFVRQNPRDQIFTPFFYKNTLCKNTEARFAQKTRTRLEHAQLQMRNLKKQFAF